MTDVRVLAWCGNSVYHDACDPGVYDDRCGACRRMFERLSTHHLVAVGTLQTALRQQVEQWRQRIEDERQRIAEHYKLPYDQLRANVRSAKLEVMVQWADELDALLPALEPIP